MFESLKNVNELIKYVAAYDSSGNSADEIDTKNEYKLLGDYLNGSSAWIKNSEGEECEFNYADLSSKDKGKLFDIMNGLKCKFGEWTNIFSDKTDIDNDIIHNYLERYSEFQKRLNKIEDEAQRNEYYEDIKQELSQVENKIKSYCQKFGLSVPLSLDVVDALHDVFNNLKNEDELKDFLKNNDETFKITEENSEKYVFLADYVLHNQLPVLTVSEGDFNKASKIIKKAYAEFFGKYDNSITAENIDKIDVIDGVHQIKRALKKREKQENPQMEAIVKDFLLNFEDQYKVVTKENAEQFSGIFRFIVEEFDKSKFSEKEQVQFEKLKKAYADFIHSWQEEITYDDIEKVNITLCSKLAVEYFNRMESMKNCAEVVQNAIEKPYDNNNLKEKVNQYIKEQNIPELHDIPENIDIGNGKFDKISTQKAQNCWIHAGINSLLSTEQGKKIIESNYYRDETTGVVAVHIPEAEQYGLHGGIYYVTPQEIIDSQETVASGEGEMTAYIIAIQKYFDEVNANPKLKEEIGEDKLFSTKNEGNHGCRLYELMTAGWYTTMLPEDNNETMVQKGIGRGFYLDSNKLYEMVEKQDGAVSVSLKDAEHSICIIGVRDGNFIIQESNNDEEFADYFVDENGKNIFEKTDSINGKPTYTIPKESLEMYDIGEVDYIKWR